MTLAQHIRAFLRRAPSAWRILWNKDDQRIYWSDGSWSYRSSVERLHEIERGEGAAPDAAPPKPGRGYRRGGCNYYAIDFCNKCGHVHSELTDSLSPFVTGKTTADLH